MEDLIKKTKGVLIFIGFIAFALSIVGDPTIDVQKQITDRGIDVVVFAAFFALAGIASLIYGLKGWSWNGLLFAPYFAFTGFALEASQDNPALSFTTATAYLFLGGLLAIEWSVDNDAFQSLKGLIYRAKRND